MNKEPLITVGTITAIATAVVALLVAFSIPLTQPQQAAILGVVAVLAPIIVMLVTRPQVTPNVKVAAFDTGTQIVAGPASKVADGVRVAIHPDQGARRVDLGEPDPDQRGTL